VHEKNWTEKGRTAPHLITMRVPIAAMDGRSACKLLYAHFLQAKTATPILQLLLPSKNFLEKLTSFSATGCTYNFCPRTFFSPWGCTCTNHFTTL